jgi:hypothetical protein
MLAAVIADAVPADLAGRRLVLALPRDSAFQLGVADDPANRQVVADAVRGVTGHAVVLAYDLRELAGSPSGPPPPLSEEDLVARLKAEFGAEELEA